MKIRSLYLLALSILLLNSCQKEVSFENGGTPSEGSLQSDVSGDCLPKTVNGTYTATTPLVPIANTLTVEVNVTHTGNYLIYTDTVNGYYFRTSGIFTTLGSNTAILGGNGTPFTAGTNNFVVHYAGTACDLAVTVLPSGSGGPAAFTLNGSPTNCSGAVIAGTYGVGVPLNAANTVTIGVDVTTIGTYAIATTATGGMTFTKTGTFTTTGPQNVVLTGTGTPTTTGPNVIPITAGSTNCSFTITVGTAGAGTLGGTGGACTPSTVNGTYTVGTAMLPANNVGVQITVTTLGAYSITTNTVTGFSFAGSGAFTSTGPQTITLLATGTPTVAGPQTFTVTYGANSCTFTVNVVTAPIILGDYFPTTVSSNWSYETDNGADDSLLRKVITATKTVAPNTYNIFMSKDPTTTDPSGFDSSGYYRKAGGSYFEYLDVGGYLGFDNPLWAEYIFLKDNVAAGNVWYSQAFNGMVSVPPAGTFPFTIRFKSTLLQKDITVSVTSSTGTVSYSNVLVVQDEFEQLVGTTWTDVTPLYGKVVTYYAKGFGIIKVEGYDPTGSIDGTTLLRRSQVF